MNTYNKPFTFIYTYTRVRVCVYIYAYVYIYDIYISPIGSVPLETLTSIDLEL